MEPAPSTAEECQRIFRAALRCCDSLPEFLLRELTHTARCDSVHDMAQVRAAVTAAVGEDAMSRIATFDETYKDRQKATQACLHYGAWVRAELGKAVGWACPWR